MVLDGLMRTTLRGLREVVIFLYLGQTTQGMPGSFWGDSPTAGRTLTQQNMGVGTSTAGRLRMGCGRRFRSSTESGAKSWDGFSVPWGGRAKPTGEQQTRGPGVKKDFLAIPAIPLRDDATCHEAALPRKMGCPWAGQHQGRHGPQSLCQTLSFCAAIIFQLLWKT